MTWAERAIDRGNPDAFPLGLLADAQWRAGLLDAARQTLAQALQRDPRNQALLRLQRRFRPS
jgi:uncharacterized protein HemY